MPAKDAIHDPVKNALIKDGWTITSESYTIRYEEIKLFADLTAERPLVAERSGQKNMSRNQKFSWCITDARFRGGCWAVYYISKPIGSFRERL